MLSRLEGSLASVLIEGESGVGKEEIARALHAGSRVASGPLVIINCGGVPTGLFASELFGHRRGAFTGAIDARKGAFESAHGGTLFLDEIGELPLDVQPLLLRALETGEIRAIGGDESKYVKVRLIAATNRDLAQEVRDGHFREDLFYRLAVVRIRVPPLRERPDDVEPLAMRFASAIGLTEIPGAVIEALKARAWPGNARELRNAVHAYAALGIIPEPTRSRFDLVRVALTEMIDMRRPFLQQREELVEQFTRLYMQALLTYTGGNQTAAARTSGLDRTYLGRLLTRLEIKRSS
jgi:transcriptional regulator with GAF, ATPase, and Fis domain